MPGRYLRTHRSGRHHVPGTLMTCQKPCIRTTGGRNSGTVCRGRARVPLTAPCSCHGDRGEGPRYVTAWSRKTRQQHHPQHTRAIYREAGRGESLVCSRVCMELRQTGVPVTPSSRPPSSPAPPCSCHPFRPASAQAQRLDFASHYALSKTVSADGRRERSRRNPALC